jgi:hypothetical protein
VQVVVDEAGQRAASSQVNDTRRRTGLPHHIIVAPGRGEDAILYGDGATLQSE